ncbi:MAG TPA: alpha/beta fold hydrolase [Stellaceae bacterium]|nr:alpha/beta fold hydrolase [Stellaceae bacterium]
MREPDMPKGGGARFATFRLGTNTAAGSPLLVWGHGWGHTHADLMPLAEAVQGLAPSVLVDFPGFGASPMPPAAWGTADYADAVAEWLADIPAARRVWIGHSFGSRVGLRLAAQHPNLVDALVLIAAPGLQRRRSLAEQARRQARSLVYKSLRALTPEGPARDRLRERFGSTDFRNAGAMRPIFVKTVTEDLEPVARQVRCPTVLVYGERDTETPPDIGERLQQMIPHSELAVLRGLDHWTVLTEGRHQLAHRIGKLLETFA